jgi:hypothetical protein
MRRRVGYIYSHSAGYVIALSIVIGIAREGPPALSIRIERNRRQSSRDVYSTNPDGLVLVADDKQTYHVQARGER